MEFAMEKFVVGLEQYTTVNVNFISSFAITEADGGYYTEYCRGKKVSLYYGDYDASGAAYDALIVFLGSDEKVFDFRQFAIHSNE